MPPAAAEIPDADARHGAAHRQLQDAERDLDELFDLIAADSGNDRAEAILRRLQQALVNLAAFPRIGRIRNDLDGSPRSFAVWPWTIIHEPTGTTGIVVWRIVDGRRDLPRRFCGRENDSVAHLAAPSFSPAIPAA